MFEKLIEELSRLEAVEAIALGGSRAGENFDDASDYDVYLYCTGPVEESARKEILGKYCSIVEVGNHFWELEDNGTFSDGIDFDILYRNLDDFAEGVASVVEDCQPQNAYTTCMWHNLLTCKILYDPSGRLTGAKERFSVPYPESLRERILDRGWKLLSSAMPAYELQIKKAANRGDLVSVNHRTAAFLETYFDMIFALNRKTHPGEKRLMQLCREQCEILPENFEENLNSLFPHLFGNPEAAQKDIDAILVALAKIK